MNGLEVIEKIKSEKFDLILMDCQMPKMDGYDATKFIRNECNDKETVIVALTANAVKEDEQRCLSIGMNEYLTKPIDISKLYIVLEKYLKKISATEVKKVTELIDKNILSKLEELTSSDDSQENNFINELIDQYKKSSQKLMSEIEKLYKEGDMIGISKRAHSLKSSSLSLGAIPLGKLCQKIEDNKKELPNILELQSLYASSLAALLKYKH